MSDFSSDLANIRTGARLVGVVSEGPVTVVAVESHGPGSATLTYRTGAGQLGERLLTPDDLQEVSELSESRWTFDADGEMFRLVSEARRMKFAHLADPFLAIDTSNIEPYPHQIDAVYNRFLEQKPLRFLLADDPGAGKTIMSGLLIRELILRGDVARCLIVAPGSLVEQWQDELWEKFNLGFDLMSRAAVEESRSGNPFLEKNFLIARVDQLSRSEDLIAKLQQSEWDLVIVDEAHKMSAHLYGGELRKTKRFSLGEYLRDLTRHLLLLSATPHNGKDEDFLAFMTLIDPDRFGGRLRADGPPDVSDVMRRLVKENLKTFEGRRLFPQRSAETLNFELSPQENALYEAVTDYVRTGMNRADQLTAEGDKRRGLVVGFALAGLQRRLASSPAAIYHSLRRRSERLTKQLGELRLIAERGNRPADVVLPKGVSVGDLENFDFDDYDDEELEDLEDAVMDASTAAATADELEAELVQLRELVRLADSVRSSGTDTKWTELREVIRSSELRDNESPRKLIIFSEHKDTLAYVAERVAAELGDPDAVLVIHGGMRREERRSVQSKFRSDPVARVLVATDAAGEGVNLQVANLMVNYDLPWNPNRIEQRFGRIHRIGQALPCHLWNLVAHQTREGQVFQLLFDKIEEQRKYYGDQVYDVLGDSHLNISLHELLLRAIRDDQDPAHASYLEEIIDSEIGPQLAEVLKERALVGGLGGADTAEIRDLMEKARSRKLQPWFVETFFKAALELYGGRITGREQGRFEITRVPAAIRSQVGTNTGSVHERYFRVTFDKSHVLVGTQRADLIAPGTPLLTAVVDKVVADHGALLQRGATLVDPLDASTVPRLLVYLDHTITDGRRIHSQRQVVAQRFQYVEIDASSDVRDPGGEPYINYAPLSDEQRLLVEKHVELGWANATAESTARDWAIENLAKPHFDEIATVTRTRVAKVWEAVRERLESQIRHWDRRAEELKEQELNGKKPKLNSGNARTRANEFETRMVKRRLQLELERDLHNSPPTIVAAALIVPQGLLDELEGKRAEPHLVADTAETDRRAMRAVMATERSIGRQPVAQAHNNPGFDILSVDPVTGINYFIEVKGYLPRTPEVKVSAQQVQQAKTNPERWRLAIAAVPDDPNAEPEVRYLTEPFRDVALHFAQTSVPLNIAKLWQTGGEPL